MAACKSFVTGLHEKLAVKTAMASNLESANATLQKELETSFLTHKMEEAGLTRDLGET